MAIGGNANTGLECHNIGIGQALLSYQSSIFTGNPKALTADKTPGLVTFVGAGPGDVELITLKGKRAIQEADLVIYAGSLVSKDILAFAKPNSIIYDSAYLTLEESHKLVKEAAYSGKRTARIHTGDPSIFGALAEQLHLLDLDHIPWKIIPGITAAMAAAAATGVSFSLPELAQSLIITRLAGRTPMPPNENLADLASHGASMAIYLAGKESARLQTELTKVLPPTTPVICVSKVSWPEEKIIKCQLGELHRIVSENNLGKQTLFLILPALNEPFKGRSKLYNGCFSHEFRKGSEDG